MTLILKQIFGLLKILNSETGTNQIAMGIAMGFIVGMAPAFSLQTLLVIFFILIFRIQIGAAFVSGFFFKFAAFLFDPVFHSVGSNILEIKSLNSAFTILYNLPIIPFTRFNESIVMGSGVLSIILCPLVFLLSRLLIQKYRVLIVDKIKDTKLFKALKATSLYKWYYKYDSLY